MRDLPNEGWYPYFPYRVRGEACGDTYEVLADVLETPLHLREEQASLLRLLDGETSLADIIRGAGGWLPGHVRAPDASRRVSTTIRHLTRRHLVCWRRDSLRPVEVGPPEVLTLEISSECNLHCSHCAVGSRGRGANELGLSRWLELVFEAASYGVRRLCLSGGEPLLYAGLRPIAERARSLGMEVEIATNGTLMTGELARWLELHGVEVQVSLDDFRPELHDEVRETRGAHERALTGVRMLRAAGRAVTIATVLSSRNVQDVGAMVALAEDLEASRMRFVPFVPKGRGRRLRSQALSAQSLHDVVREIQSLRCGSRIAIAEMEFEGMVRPRQAGLVRTTGPVSSSGCGGARTVGTVTSSGEVLPCHFFEGVRADSVVTRRLRDVWERSRFLTWFRQLSPDDMHGRCRECDWRHECGGGCRARAFAEGDLLGTNPSCWVGLAPPAQPGSSH